jgi:16S rRNA (cytidine1402-2'-O)-methyltransferase
MSMGTLYLIATPIGNLEDVSYRAIRLLKEVNLIACEDTRHTARLLSHFGITTPRESYHEHNETTRTERLIRLLQEGKNIALVSDAGTPLISDPGFTLVAACRKSGISVIPVPGPSAAVAALSGSGLPPEPFYFAGFLPARQSQRRQALKDLAGVKATMVIYEAPHRVLNTLDDMSAVWGERQACLARELTKIHEEWLFGTFGEIRQTLANRDSVRGEITLVVEGASGEVAQIEFPASLEEHLELEMRRTGSSLKEALKEVARQRGLSRREAYRLMLDEKDTRSKG